MSHFEPGTVIGGRYRLVGEIGRGGMGTVWRAHDVVLDRSVAVKLMAAAPASGRTGRGDPGQSRLLRGLRSRSLRSHGGPRDGWLWQEARAAARLTHPHITSVFDYGGPPQSPVPYIVMELLDGRSLAERLADGPLPRGEALVVAAQVSSALAAAHRRGVLHRDVTPNNIVLTADGAKVVDFGISTIVGSGDPQTYGTPRYLAPEVAAGEPATTAADVYAFGMVLAELLPGLSEPDGDPPHETGEALAALVRSCRSVAPASRPQMAEVAERIRELAGPAAAPIGAGTETARARLSRAAATLRLPGTGRLTRTVRMERARPGRPEPGAGAPGGWRAERRHLAYVLAAGICAVALALLLVAVAGDPFDGLADTSEPGTHTKKASRQSVPQRLRALLHAGGDPSDNQVALRFDVQHRGTAPVRLSKVELRYWFTADDGPDGFEVWCDWAELGCEHVRRHIESMTRTRTGADHVLVIGFEKSAGWLVPEDSTGEIQIRTNKQDWSKFDESDDYSYRWTSDYTTAPHVTAYIDGELVWGTEPE